MAIFVGLRDRFTDFKLARILSQNWLKWKRGAEKSCEVSKIEVFRQSADQPA